MSSHHGPHFFADCKWIPIAIKFIAAYAHIYWLKLHKYPVKFVKPYRGLLSAGNYWHEIRVQNLTNRLTLGFNLAILFSKVIGQPDARHPDAIYLVS